MRSFHPASQEWLHYEASEAALKRAADALQVTKDTLHSLGTRLSASNVSPQDTERQHAERQHAERQYAERRYAERRYAELESELEKRREAVLERACEHSKRIDSLVATNLPLEDAPHFLTSTPLSLEANRALEANRVLKGAQFSLSPDILAQIDRPPSDDPHEEGDTRRD